VNVVVTGATGYIGNCFTSLLVEKGHNVIALSRNKPQKKVFNWIPYDLLSDNEVALPEEIDVLVHLAANTESDKKLENEKEISAAGLLINAALRVSAKFVFISSQTANANSPTEYGRIKWRIEQEVLLNDGLVVRPGQVYGGETRGLYGFILKAVKRSFLLPSFVLPSPKVQPIHVADFSEGLLRICEDSQLVTGVFCLAEPQPVLFKSFIYEISKKRLHIKRVFLPVPAPLVKIVSIVIGKKLSGKLGLDRIISLIDLPVMETQSDLNTLNLRLRDVRFGMHSSGDSRRRQILQEAHAVLGYVIKSNPEKTLLRRYLEIIESLKDSKPLGLPCYYIKFPFLLSLLDATSWQSKHEYDEYIWRLDAATILTETTPSGSYYFLGLGSKKSFVRNVLTMTLAIIQEVYWRVLRIIFLPFVRFSLNKFKNSS